MDILEGANRPLFAALGNQGIYGRPQLPIYLTCISHGGGVWDGGWLENIVMLNVS